MSFISPILIAEPGSESGKSQRPHHPKPTSTENTSSSVDAHRHAPDISGSDQEPNQAVEKQKRRKFDYEIIDEDPKVEAEIDKIKFKSPFIINTTNSKKLNSVFYNQAYYRPHPGTNRVYGPARHKLLFGHIWRSLCRCSGNLYSCRKFTIFVSIGAQLASS